MACPATDVFVICATWMWLGMGTTETFGVRPSNHGASASASAFPLLNCHGHSFRSESFGRKIFKSQNCWSITISNGIILHGVHWNLNPTQHIGIKRHCWVYYDLMLWWQYLQSPRIRPSAMLPQSSRVLLQAVKMLVSVKDDGSNIAIWKVALRSAHDAKGCMPALLQPMPGTPGNSSSLMLILSCTLEKWHGNLSELEPSYDTQQWILEQFKHVYTCIRIHNHQWLLSIQKRFKPHSWVNTLIRFHIAQISAKPLQTLQQLSTLAKPSC